MSAPFRQGMICSTSFFHAVSNYLRIIFICVLFLPDMVLCGNTHSHDNFFADDGNSGILPSETRPESDNIYRNGGESGWKANPSVIKEMEERRPVFMWHENEVPEYELPDPLERSDGTIISSVENWKLHRPGILEIFRKDMYGRRPGLPDELTFNLVREDISAMDGAATLRIIEIHSAHEGRDHIFELIIFLPNQFEEPVPVFLLMNNRSPDNTDPTRQEKSGFWPAEEVIERGYGIAAIQNQDLAPDDHEKYREGIIRLFEGDAAMGKRPPDAWKGIAAWGWGASRAMDYFETDNRIDCSRVAILGHSRGGKASLWAGAEDKRFALVISNNSGCGGAALSKRRYGETVENVNWYTHWFADNFKRFNNREDKLHFDQHMLLALIAPRALYIASADMDLWADPRGEFLALANASPVFGLWSHPPIDPEDMPPLDEPLFSGPLGYHIRSGGHNLTRVDWHYFMDFADRIWR